MPLFIEELTKAVVEAGETAARALSPPVPHPVPPHRIPTTLHASLTSRLDRLGPAKELAQIGAVIGRRFSHALLAAVAGRGGPELRALLGQLIAAGLVFQEGGWPQATFRFKHALVQSVAYESLLRSARQPLHARIAATLEQQFPETAPEQLAQHWALAGDAGRAVSYWRTAGQQAIGRCANREAIAQLGKGLRMLERLPHGPERDRSELGLQLLLAEALMADRGWTAPETRPCYDRARELCQRLGDSEGLYPVLYGQFSHHLSRGEADAAHGLALETLHLTEAGGDAVLQSMAHSMLGMSLFSRGELATAHTHLQTALSLDQPDSRSHTFLSPGHNVAIASLWLALTLGLLGYPEQAARHAAAGLRAARALCQPAQPGARPGARLPLPLGAGRDRFAPPGHRGAGDAGGGTPLPVLCRRRADLSRLGAVGRARRCPRRRRPARGHGDLHGSRLGGASTLFLRQDRAALRRGRPARRRLRSSRQGAGAGRAVRPALVRGGDPSLERRAAGAMCRRGAGRSLPAAEPRDGAPAGRPAVGTAGRLQPGPAVARPGQSRATPARSSGRSMAGSPRASIRPISGRPRRCSTR